jgi:hypothetical protein
MHGHHIATSQFRARLRLLLQLILPVPDEVTREVVHLHRIRRLRILKILDFIAFIRPNRGWLPVLDKRMADSCDAVGFCIVVRETFLVH